MRSYNDAALLPRTLASLDRQVGVSIELAVFESASQDNSVEIFQEHGFARMTELKPGTYRSSKVLNQGVSEAETEVVVFLNSDAVLLQDDALRKMAETLLADSKVGGVYARQVVRADAGSMTRFEYQLAFDHRDELGEQGNWLTLVCSAIRKSVWEKLPFDERLTFAEDAVWSSGIKQLGFRCEYVEGAEAEHSHDYTWAERKRRAFGDAAALAVMAESPPTDSVISGFLLPWLRRSAGHSLKALRAGIPWRIPQLWLHHFPYILGNWQGARAGWKHFHESDESGKSPGLQPKL